MRWAMSGRLRPFAPSSPGFCAGALSWSRAERECGEVEAKASALCTASCVSLFGSDEDVSWRPLHHLAQAFVLAPKCEVTDLEFLDPRDLEEAHAFLERYGESATVLAGGTDAVPALLRGEVAPQAFLHIRHIQGLSGVAAADRTVVGATATHRQLACDEHVSREHTAIAEAARTVGGRQTQNVGTIGGNVVNASPAADLMPALLVGDATVRLASRDGARELPLHEFVTGRKETCRHDNELLTHISLQRPGPRTGETYLKLGRRGAMEVALVGVAARLSCSEDGTIEDARLAVCAAGPKAFRISAEHLLVGTRGEDDVTREVVAAAEAEAKPIDDVRSPADYRKRVLGHLIRQAIATSQQRAAA